jgi:hypothetical protein
MAIAVELAAGSATCGEKKPAGHLSRRRAVADGARGAGRADRRNPGPGGGNATGFAKLFKYSHGLAVVARQLNARFVDSGRSSTSSSAGGLRFFAVTIFVGLAGRIKSAAVQTHRTQRAVKYAREGARFRWPRPIGAPSRLFNS